MDLATFLRTAIVAAAVSGLSRAGEPPLAASPSNFNDTKIAVQAKSMLAADPELRSASLLISVLQGAVTVQGEIAEASADRVKRLIAGVPGVKSVQLDCRNAGSADPLARKVAERLNPVAKSGPNDAPAALNIPGPPPATGGLPSVAVGPPTVRTIPDRVASDLPTLPGQLEPYKPPTVVAMREPPPATPLIPGGLLQAPVKAAPHPDVAVTPLPPAPSGPRPYATIPPPNVPVRPVGSSPPARSNPDDLGLALLDLRQSDRRYQGMTVEVREGVAVISGIGNSDAAASFAEALRRLPGITRVDIGAIRNP